MSIRYAAVRPTSFEKPWLGQVLHPFVLLLEKKGGQWLKVTGTWKPPDGPGAPYKEVEVSPKEVKDVLASIQSYETSPKLAAYLSKEKHWNLSLKPYPRRKSNRVEAKDIILASTKIDLSSKLALDSFIPYHLLI